MPGSSLSWSAVALLMSSFWADLAAVAEALDAFESACPTAIPPTSERAKTRTAICAASFLWIANIDSSCSSVDTTLANSVRHPVDGQHVSGDTIVHVVSLGVAHHVVEGRLHDAFQLLVDDGFFPEVALAVLHPFEIRSGDAAGIGQDVGNHEYALVGEHVVCGRRGGAVGAFGEDAALHAVDVAAGDDILGCGRNQDLTLGGEQFSSIALLRAGKSVHGAVLLLEVDQSRHIHAGLVVQASAHFGDADDFIAGLVHELRRIGADIA